MTFDEYQDRADKTDRFHDEGEKSREIPLFGLAGEVGTLLSEYKKFIRDDNKREFVSERIAEELGDVFWYATNVATKFGLRLHDVLAANLVKVEDRWLPPNEMTRVRFFDEGFPEDERLPRWFDVTYSEIVTEKGRRVEITRNDQRIGSLLTDNSYIDDGYRFHDAFHFAYATVLGWSPVTRRNLDVKRRSQKAVDEVEDGGRAIVYEEAIAGLAFERARKVKFFDGFHTVEAHLIDTVKELTANLEVRVRSRHEWEAAILGGFEMWRELRDNNGGRVRYDLENRKMRFLGPIKSPMAPG